MKKSLDSHVKTNEKTANAVKRVMNVSKGKTNTPQQSDPIAAAKKATKEIKRQILREETEEALKENKKHVFVPFIADEVKADEKETKEILMIPVKKGSKTEKPEKKEKTVAVKKEKGPSIVDVLTPYIEKGKSTKKELIAIGKEKLPHLSESTLSTVLTDSKNPKYNKFAKLTMVTEDGLIKFVK